MPPTAHWWTRWNSSRLCASDVLLSASGWAAHLGTLLGRQSTNAPKLRPTHDLHRPCERLCVAATIAKHLFPRHLAE